MSLSDSSPSCVTKAPTMPAIIMGTWEETYPGSGVFNALVGGRPKPDWSGLEENQPYRAKQGSHYRPVDPIKRVKGSVYRTQGLDTKFLASHSIHKFQKDVWNHLVLHGLDTIAYLNDPFSPSVMINIVENHPRFCHNHEEAVILSKKGNENFDDWDKENDADARQFLLNSLDDSLLEALKHHIQPEFSFATVWLYLIHHVITTSSARFDDIKAAIRNMSPLQYEAQNITQLTNDYIDKFKELESGGQMDYNLIISVLQSLRSAHGPDIYKHSLLNLETKAEYAINTIAFMPLSEKDSYMKKEKLDIQSICYVAATAYRTARDRNQWGPLQQVRDRRGVPHASLVTLLDGSTAYAITPAGKRELICWNCGEKGHTKQDCTKPDTNNEFKPGGTKFKDRSCTKTKKEANWNLVAPKKGDPETKTVEGCTWKYCTKCECWNSSHTTAEHVTKRGSNDNSDQNEDQDEEELKALWSGGTHQYSMIGALYNIYMCEPASKEEESKQQRALLFKASSSIDHLQLKYGNLNDNKMVSKAVLTAPDHFRSNTVGNRKAFNVVWDSGASLSVTNDKNDFVSFEPLDIYVDTVGRSDTKTCGIGMVKYNVISTNGELHTIISKAFYIPTAKQKLLSITDVLSKLPGGKFYMSASCTVLETPNKMVSELEIKNDPATNLPTSQAFCPEGANATSMHLHGSSITTANIANDSMNLGWKHGEEVNCWKELDRDDIQLEGATGYYFAPPFAHALTIPAFSAGREEGNANTTSTSSPIITPSDIPTTSSAMYRKLSALNSTVTSNLSIMNTSLFLANHQLEGAKFLLTKEGCINNSFGNKHSYDEGNEVIKQDSQIDDRIIMTITRNMKKDHCNAVMTSTAATKEEEALLAKVGRDKDTPTSNDTANKWNHKSMILMIGMLLLYLSTKTGPDIITSVMRSHQVLAHFYSKKGRESHHVVKWHFFWSHIKKASTNPDGEVTTEKVTTDLQRADYLTTGSLDKDVFINCRKLNQGW